jgi:hypothetical protein
LSCKKENISDNPQQDEKDSNDYYHENFDLKRQVLLLQQQVEEKNRTIRLLQQQMVTKDKIVNLYSDLIAIILELRPNT